MKPEGMQCWQLHPSARLRRTAAGGAVFLPRNGTVVELDAEALTAITLLNRPDNARGLRRRLLSHSSRNVTLAETDILLRELAAQGVLVESSAQQTGAVSPSQAPRLPESLLPAPDSVHLQLNNACNLRCPSCYVELNDKENDGLPLERIETLLREWASMGVFQLALGGGEPLMSSKFAPVVRLARRHGLLPNVTTNGWLLTDALLDEIQDDLGEIRLSLNDAVTVNLPLVETKVALLRTHQQRFGFNLIVTHRNLPNLANQLRWACAQEPNSITLIRPKPMSRNLGWYQANVLTHADVTQLGALLQRLKPLFDRTTLSVDCAFSFLFHGQPPETLQARGIAGCAMGERLVTVKWNGDVYPCSHFHGEKFQAGNVRTKSFQDIWERSEVFIGIRRELAGVSGNCGLCTNKPFCKGCRAIACQRLNNWLAPDLECPHEVDSLAG